MARPQVGVFLLDEVLLGLLVGGAGSLSLLHIFLQLLLNLGAGSRNLLVKLGPQLGIDVLEGLLVNLLHLRCLLALAARGAQHERGDNLRVLNAHVRAQRVYAEHHLDGLPLQNHRLLLHRLLRRLLLGLGARGHRLRRSRLRRGQRLLPRLGRGELLLLVRLRTSERLRGVVRSVHERHGQVGAEPGQVEVVDLLDVRDARDGDREVGHARLLLGRRLTVGIHRRRFRHGRLPQAGHLLARVLRDSAPRDALALLQALLRHPLGACGSAVVHDERPRLTLQALLVDHA
mmetsp:Transcript_87330/g.224947  ORF Transcript_87330/g.224947 Transcript_87330/m.224947 type:complete len:289 (+) Transcript_87330:649-1515(+)